MKTLVKVALSVFFLSFSTFLAAQQSDFGWLIGTWKQENKMSFEVWRREGEFLSGSAYKVDQSGNKSITEEIKLIKKGSDFYYVPDVAGPQGEIEFKVTYFDKEGFTAENLAHDFPKKIIYKINEKQLIATISGGTKSISYSFQKIE